MEVAISEFKAKCIQLIKTSAETGEDLVVTLRGKPLARVVGMPAVRQRVLGGQPDALDRQIPDAALIDSDFEADWHP